MSEHEHSRRTLQDQATNQMGKVQNTPYVYNTTNRDATHLIDVMNQSQISQSAKRNISYI